MGPHGEDSPLGPRRLEERDDAVRWSARDRALRLAAAAAAAKRREDEVGAHVEGARVLTLDLIRDCEGRVRRGLEERRVRGEVALDQPLDSGGRRLGRRRPQQLDAAEPQGSIASARATRPWKWNATADHGPRTIRSAANIRPSQSARNGQGHRRWKSRTLQSSPRCTRGAASASDREAVGKAAEILVLGLLQHERWLRLLEGG